MIRHQHGESTVPLYKMTSPSGKSYIGITTGKLINRMHRHRAAVNQGSPYAIHCAIRKYGFKAFAIEVLSEETDIATLNLLETAAIAEHGTLYPNGYNLTSGGDGVAGPHSAKRTKAMWENMSAEQRSAAIEKMGAASRKFWGGVTETDVAVMRERGAKAARDWWANATEERREQRARNVAAKRAQHTEEQRAETSRRCSAASSAHWANQTTEEKQAHAVVRSAASKNTWANLTDEQRADRSRKMKAGRAKAREARDAVA